MRNVKGFQTIGALLLILAIAFDLRSALIYTFEVFRSTARKIPGAQDRK